MKKCRMCQKEIDAKAKKCPYCQAKQGNWAQRHPILTGFIVLILFFIIVGSNSSKSQKAEPVAKLAGSETATTEPTATPQTTFKVGQVVEMKDYQLTVNSVKKAASKGYTTPMKKGNEFVFVNVTIVNKSDKEVSYNPYDFKIQDSTGNQTNTTFASTDDELHSGSLAAGGKVTGTLSFEAPKGDAQLSVIYQPNMWLDNQRITVELQ